MYEISIYKSVCPVRYIITMSEVDKEKLAVALRYPPSSEVKSVKNVYWGQSLEETQPLKSLYVNGIESSISIPISNQVGLHYCFQIFKVYMSLKMVFHNC